MPVIVRNEQNWLEHLNYYYLRVILPQDQVISTALQSAGWKIVRVQLQGERTALQHALVFFLMFTVTSTTST